MIPRPAHRDAGTASLGSMSISLSAATTAPPRTTRHWAAAGVLAGVASLASVLLSLALSRPYEEGSIVTPALIEAGLEDKRPLLVAFHITTVAAALLLVVFAAGLRRRIRSSRAPQALAPDVAFAGLLLVAAAQLLGSGLDTEFLFGIGDKAVNLPEDASTYSHWIATIPWLWAGGGLAGLAVGVASRAGVVPRWVGGVGFVLGGLVVLIALSPLQYLAALPGGLWLLVTAFGFAASDRRQLPSAQPIVAASITNR